MPRLTCQVESCIYNQDEYCSAGRISVDGERASDSDATQCNTFYKQSAGTNVSYEPSPEISVQCDAVKCKYNSGHMCFAESIQISGDNVSDSSSDTLCATFNNNY